MSPQKSDPSHLRFYKTKINTEFLSWIPKKVNLTGLWKKNQFYKIMEAGSYICILTNLFFFHTNCSIPWKKLINRLLEGRKKKSKSMLEYKQFPNNNRYRHMRTYTDTKLWSPKSSSKLATQPVLIQDTLINSKPDSLGLGGSTCVLSSF